jgi:hypothetical protein
MNGRDSAQFNACPTPERAEAPSSPLLGKTALVTGASRGIGASVARQLGQLGADVAKKAGENAIRAMIPELYDRGIRLVIVSGDLIEGTITPKLLERQSRGLIEKRRQAVGSLPSVEEFAAAIVQAGMGESYSSGDTIYVGSTDWS